MADVEEPPKRKSVAFSEDAVVVDGNGEATEVATENKSTADSHALTSDKEVDDVAEMLKGLGKKKKKSSSKDKEAKDDVSAVPDGEFDPSALKKKKKSKKKVADVDDFEAKLADAGVGEEDGNKEGGEEATDGQEGNMDEGTGIWQHSNMTPIGYSLLLERFFGIIAQKNPDFAPGSNKSYKIPPPQCMREGNKKTIFANIADICKRMKRSDEHVIQFMFAELGTTGSVDGSRRLVIKGRFKQKDIEMVLRRYIVEYVTCKTCRSPDTELSKGENRLYFVTCNRCGSRRSVTAINKGFTAQIGKRKRMQG